MEIKPNNHVTIIGCGYVGMALGHTLYQNGISVTGTTRSPRNFERLHQLGIKPLQLELTTAQGFHELEKTDLVVFCSAPTEPTQLNYEQVYEVGMKQLLTYFYFHKPTKLIYTSSIGVYEEENGNWVDENTPLKGGTSRVRTLIKAEKMVRESPFDTIVARLGGIYGPNRYKDFKNNVAGPQKYVNLIHIDDVVKGILFLFEKGTPGETYNIVDNEPVLKTISTESERSRQNKRCSNKKLRDLGYRFVVPTHREGKEKLA